MSNQPEFSTLPDGRVCVKVVEANQPVVHHYKAIGATIYVEPEAGSRSLLMLGGATRPERLRDGETLEDAVRRLHAPKQAGIPWASCCGFVLMAVVVGGLGLACASSGYWFLALWAKDAAPALFVLWGGLCAVGAGFTGWLLVLLMRQPRAPWPVMLLAVALLGWIMWHWLGKPFGGGW